MLNTMSRAACGYSVKRSLDNAAMNDFSTALKKARTQAHMTMEDVAQRFGITRSAVSQWEDPAKNSRPDLEKLPALADMYRVDLGSLLNGLVVRTDTGDLNAAVMNTLPGAAPIVEWHPDDPISVGFAAIPAVMLKVGAGSRLAPEVDPEVKQRLYRMDSFAMRGIKIKNLVAYKVEGDSMEPVIFSGDWVAIDRTDKAIPSIAKRRDVRACTFVFRWDQEIMVKMLQEQPDGAIVVTSINASLQQPFTIPASERERLEIFGRVVERSGMWA